MKDAAIVNLNGQILNFTLLDDSTNGLIPLMRTTEEADYEEVYGYIIAVKIPEGMYQPYWDFDEEVWLDHLSPEEIEELKNAPQPETLEQKIENLSNENVDTMLALAEVYEQDIVQNEIRKTENVDTMLALTEAYELILQLTARIESLEAQVQTGGTTE